MAVRLPIEVPQERLAAFCKKHRIRKLSFFGSVLREDFTPESDVDVLVEFEAEAKPRLHDLMEMEGELSRLFGRKVDLVERESIDKSPNYIQRKHILGSLEPLYVEG